MVFPHGTFVTVLESGVTTDVYGDATGGPTAVEWGPCAIAPRSSVERADSRSPAVVTGLTVYGPPREFGARDQLVIGSGTYAGTWDIEGLPGDWENPFTGWHPGVEVAVKRASVG